MTTRQPTPEANPRTCWDNLTTVLDAGIDRVILYGPPGTGKTYAGLTQKTAGKPAYRVICNEDMTSADITGHFAPTGEGTWAWNEGQVIKAWKAGARVVCDEIDRASGDVLSLLLACFDSPASASWANPLTGEVVRPADGFSVIMTTNIEEMRELPTALRDRFPVAIRVDHPHPDALKELSPDLREAAKASADAEKSRRYSVRSFYAFDTLRSAGVATDLAAQLIFGDGAEDIVDALKVEAISE